MDFIERTSVLLDAELEEASISSRDDRVSVLLRIRPRHDKGIACLRLVLTDIRRFDFHYDEENYFYTIDRYKAFRIEDGFYLALDPYDERKVPSEEDCGVVVAREIAAVTE